MNAPADELALTFDGPPRQWFPDILRAVVFGWPVPCLLWEVSLDAWEGHPMPLGRFIPAATAVASICGLLVVYPLWMQTRFANRAVATDVGLTVWKYAGQELHFGWDEIRDLREFEVRWWGVQRETFLRMSSDSITVLFSSTRINRFDALVDALRMHATGARTEGALTFVERVLMGARSAEHRR
jgi:hypothetical protein